MKKLICLLGVVCLLGAFSLSAQPAGDYPELDQSAIKNMPRAERLQYQQAYKAQLEAIAKARGWEPTAPGPTGQTVGAKAIPEVPGSSITYHSGAISAPANSSVMVGNRFDTALTTGGTTLGPVELSGSVTAISFSLVAASGNAFFSMYDQLNTGAGTANQVTTVSVGPFATGANTFTFPTAFSYVGSTFLAGIWNFTAGGDTMALATGTVGGQGFHGVSINDGSPGNGFATIPSMNGAITVNGNVSTPVELQSFTVD